MIRRFLSAFAAFAVMLSAVTAVQAEEPSKKSTKIYDGMVYVEGKLPAYQLDKDDSITLMMVKNDADLSTPEGFAEGVGYIDEIYPDFDGEYKLMFEFDGDTSDYSLLMKLGSNDVTSSVIEVASFKDVINVDIYDGASGGLVEFCTKTVNKYKDQKNCSIVFAVYDKDGRLCDKVISDKAMTGYETENSFRTYLKKPENMSAAKAFVFNSMTDIKPLTGNFVKGEDKRLSSVTARYIGGEGYNTSESKGFRRCVNDVNEKNEKQEWDSYGAELTEAGGYIAFDNIDMTDMTAIQMYAGANTQSFRLGIYTDEISDENKIGEYVVGGQMKQNVAVYGSAALSEMSEGKHTLYIKSEETTDGASCKIKFIRLTDKADERKKSELIANTDANITYTGSWSEGENGYKVSDASDASAELKFSGTAVDINGVIGKDCGYADVYIDGVFDKTLKLYNKNTLKRCVYTKANLSDGEHTVMIKKITGEKLYLDGFKVYHSPIRVVCIGDSITQGTGSTEQGYFSWPAQLQELLGSGYVVFDNARHGCTLESWQSDWMEPSTALLNADIVICAIGTNDYCGGWASFDAGTYKADYTAFMNMIKGYSEVPPRMYVSKPPLRDRNAVEAKAAVWKMFDEISSENSWPIVDFLSPLLEEGQNYTDGLHLNNRGYGVMAEIANFSLPCPEIMNKKKLDYAISELNKRNAELSD